MGRSLLLTNSVYRQDGKCCTIIGGIGNLIIARWGPSAVVVVRPFLTGRIFQEIFEGGVQNHSWVEKNVSLRRRIFREYNSPKYQLGEKSSNSPSRGIFWIKIFL